MWGVVLFSPCVYRDRDCLELNWEGCIHGVLHSMTWLEGCVVRPRWNLYPEIQLETEMSGTVVDLLLCMDGNGGVFHRRERDHETKRRRESEIELCGQVFGFYAGLRAFGSFRIVYRTYYYEGACTPSMCVCVPSSHVSRVLHRNNLYTTTSANTLCAN